MRPRSWCQLKVTLENRCPLAWFDLLKPYCFTMTVPKDGLAFGRPHVGYPVRTYTEHCH
jgi:hypothetical protein